MKFNNVGLSLVEMLVTMAILTAIMGGLFWTMSTGQDTWATTDTYIELQNNLRFSIEAISKELRESGSDSLANSKVLINDGGGTNSTDILRFSIPIICQVGGTINDVNGDVANWGAPLTMYCNDSTCMDADDDCATRDYEFIEYQINGSNQLIRRVLSDTFSVAREDIIVQNITDLQAVLSTDQNMVAITITSTLVTSRNRQLSSTINMDVFLRNRG